MIRYKFAIINLYTKKNNTHISLTNILGQTLYSCSCGSLGFKKSKRSSSYAAECTGYHIGKKALTWGIKFVQLSLRGLGSSRVSSIRGLRASGLRISRIKDNNRLAYSGTRLKKKRRI